MITGTGSYVPQQVIKNEEFVGQAFYEKDGQRIESPGQDIVQKFEDITGIYERRWMNPRQVTSDMAVEAARLAIEDAGIDPETLDQIILAHNFGEVIHGTIQSDAVPCLASRVKSRLGIKNPSCVAYDLLFGCPGWIQGVIHADAFFKAGVARRILVIGAEALSRVVDVYDRDTMIFSDGAGATVLEAVESDEKKGLLASAAASDTVDEVSYLYMGPSNAPDADPKVRYIKMLGRKIYEYSLIKVPAAMKIALEKAEIPVDQVKKILLHQANEKMDAAIVQRFYRQFGIRNPGDDKMPMNIKELGNSSVATVPTLYDMVLKGNLENHQIAPGDVLIFASVGAGMNLNAFVYRQ
ncbi:MAG: ketoacyl-ACP synthase III [Bacteroidales bacterium]